MPNFRFRLSALKQWPEIFRSIFSKYFLVVSTALILAVLWIYQVEAENSLSSHDSFALTRILICLGLCLPAFIALHIHITRQNQRVKHFTVGLLVILLTVGMYYMGYDLRAGKQFYRTMALFLAFHGLISISAYHRYSSVNDFWRFNTNLLLRTIASLFFTLVLYLGVIAAIAALNNLFGVHISNNVYMDLLIVALVVYNTFFVLAGIKTSPDDPGTEFQYPLSLKVFTQFVLIPLMALYAIILYAFSIKIIVLWSLPKGWIAYLVLLFSISGILGFLLIYPIRNSSDKKWVRIYSRTFFIALMPLILLLHVSIWTRVGQYGFTINRYVVAILTLWLTSISVYFLISKKDNIIVIPVSLSALFLFVSFGPWSFNHISQQSQRNRIESLINKNQILANYKKGNIDDYRVNDRIATELNSIIDYLLQNHGAESMKGLGIKGWDDLADSILIRQQKIMGKEGADEKRGNTADTSVYSDFSYRMDSHQFLRTINASVTETTETERFEYFYAKEQNQLDITPYSKLIPFDVNISSKDDKALIALDTMGFQLNIDGKKFPIDASIATIKALNVCGPECYNAGTPIIVIGSQQDITYKIIIYQLNGRLSSIQKPQFENAAGYLLLNQ